MSTKTIDKLGAKVATDDYLALVRQFPLTSIRSKANLKAARHVVDDLLKKGRLIRGEEMYLDALSDLIIRYEDQHVAMPKASQADMLAHLLEARRVSQAQLARDTKVPAATLSNVLAGRRALSKANILALSEYFSVGVGVWL